MDDVGVLCAIASGNKKVLSTHSISELLDKVYRILNCERLASREEPDLTSGDVIIPGIEPRKIYKALLVWVISVIGSSDNQISVESVSSSSKDLHSEKKESPNKRKDNEDAERELAGHKNKKKKRKLADSHAGESENQIEDGGQHNSGDTPEGEVDNTLSFYKKSLSLLCFLLRSLSTLTASGNSVNHLEGAVSTNSGAALLQAIQTAFASNDTTMHKIALELFQALFGKHGGVGWEFRAAVSVYRPSIDQFSQFLVRIVESVAYGQEEVSEDLLLSLVSVMRVQLLLLREQGSTKKTFMLFTSKLLLPLLSLRGALENTTQGPQDQHLVGRTFSATNLVDSLLSEALFSDTHLPGFISAVTSVSIATDVALGVALPSTEETASEPAAASTANVGADYHTSLFRSLEQFGPASDTPNEDKKSSNSKRKKEGSRQVVFTRSSEKEKVQTNLLRSLPHLARLFTAKWRDLEERESRMGVRSASEKHKKGHQQVPLDFLFWYNIALLPCRALLSSLHTETLEQDSPQLFQRQSQAVRSLCKLLECMREQGIYDPAKDTLEGTQRKRMDAVVSIIFKAADCITPLILESEHPSSMGSEISLFERAENELDSFYSLLSVDHRLLEPHLERVAGLCYQRAGIKAQGHEIKPGTSFSKSKNPSERLMVHMIQTYASLRQLPTLFASLLDSIPALPCLPFSSSFSTRDSRGQETAVLTLSVQIALGRAISSCLHGQLEALWSSIVERLSKRVEAFRDRLKSHHETLDSVSKELEEDTKCIEASRELFDIFATHMHISRNNANAFKRLSQALHTDVIGPTLSHIIPLIKEKGPQTFSLVASYLRSLLAALLEVHHRLLDVQGKCLLQPVYLPFIDEENWSLLDLWEEIQAPIPSSPSLSASSLRGQDGAVDSVSALRCAAINLTCQRLQTITAQICQAKAHKSLRVTESPYFANEKSTGRRKRRDSSSNPIESEGDSEDETKEEEPPIAVRKEEEVDLLLQEASNLAAAVVKKSLLSSSNLPKSVAQNIHLIGKYLQPSHADAFWRWFLSGKTTMASRQSVSGFGPVATADGQQDLRSQMLLDAVFYEIQPLRSQFAVTVSAMIIEYLREWILSLSSISASSAGAPSAKKQKKKKKNRANEEATEAEGTGELQPLLLQACDKLSKLDGNGKDPLETANAALDEVTAVLKSMAESQTIKSVAFNESALALFELLEVVSVFPPEYFELDMAARLLPCVLLSDLALQSAQSPSEKALCGMIHIRALLLNIMNLDSTDNLVSLLCRTKESLCLHVVTAPYLALSACNFGELEDKAKATVAVLASQSHQLVRVVARKLRGQDAVSLDIFTQGLQAFSQSRKATNAAVEGVLSSIITGVLWLPVQELRSQKIRSALPAKKKRKLQTAAAVGETGPASDSLVALATTIYCQNENSKEIGPKRMLVTALCTEYLLQHSAQLRGSSPSGKHLQDKLSHMILDASQTLPLSDVDSAYTLVSFAHTLRSTSLEVTQELEQSRQLLSKTLAKHIKAVYHHGLDPERSAQLLGTLRQALVYLVNEPNVRSLSEMFQITQGTCEEQTRESSCISEFMGSVELIGVLLKVTDQEGGFQLFPQTSEVTIFVNQLVPLWVRFVVSLCLQVVPQQRAKDGEAVGMDNDSSANALQAPVNRIYEVLEEIVSRRHGPQGALKHSQVAILTECFLPLTGMANQTATKGNEKVSIVPQDQRTTQCIVSGVSQVIQALLKSYPASMHSLAPQLVGATQAMLRIMFSMSSRQHSSTPGRTTEQPDATVNVVVSQIAAKLARIYELLKLHAVAFRKYVTFILADYIIFSQRMTTSFAPEVRRALQPGIYSLIDICRKHELQQLHSVLDSTGRILLKAVLKDHEENHKFAGKI